jgi:hypothetical protein
MRLRILAVGVLGVCRNPYAEDEVVTALPRTAI